MNRLTISAGVAAAALMATTAHAGTVDVQWTEAGETASWQQSSAPTDAIPFTGDYTTVTVWNYKDSLGGAAAYVSYFASAAYGGGWSDAAGAFDVSGDQVYSGSEAAPLFAIGAYNGVDAVTGDAGVLTIAAPEPAAWALMIVGFGLVGSAMRRRRVAFA